VTELPEVTDGRESAPTLPGGPQRRGVHPILKVLLGIMVLSAGSCVGCYVDGQRAQAEGRKYAEKTLPIISQPWDAEAIVERATPDFLSAMPRDKVVAFTSFLAGRLGPLKHPALFQDWTWRTYVGTRGLIVTTVHFADCEFEKAPARITLTLVRQRGVWQIHGLNVNSDALLK
jgi:hypothetical protein